MTAVDTPDLATVVDDLAANDAGFLSFAQAVHAILHRNRHGIPEDAVVPGQPIPCTVCDEQLTTYTAWKHHIEDCLATVGISLGAG